MSQDRDNLLRKTDFETINQYVRRICLIKDEFSLTWNDVAEIVYEETGLLHSSSYYRKRTRDQKFNFIDEPRYSSGNINMTVEEGSNTYDNAEQLTLFENSNSVDNKYNQLVKERMKISDERVQNNALLRRIAREETLKEIAADYASTMQNFIPLKF